MQDLSFPTRPIKVQQRNALHLTLSNLNTLVQFTGEICIFYQALGKTIRKKTLFQWGKSLAS